MTDASTPNQTALIVGATGIAGSAVAEQLLDDGGWTVYGLCRNPDQLDPRITPVVADLRDPESVAAAVADIRPTHVFYTSWVRMPTEAENCAVNGAMVKLTFRTSRARFGPPSCWVQFRV